MPTSSCRTLPRALAGGAVLAATLLAPATTPAGAEPLATSIMRAEHRLALLTASIDRTVEQYDAARLALSTAQREAAAASAATETARRDFASRRTLLTAYAVSAYQDRSLAGIVAAVQGSPADYLDRLSMLREVSHRQAEIVQTVADSRRRLAVAEGAARDAVSRAAAATAKIATTRAAIEAQIIQQRRIVDGLKAEQARLDALAVARAAAAARASAAQRAAAWTSAHSARSQAEHVRRVVGGGSGSRGTHHAPPPVSGRAGTAVRAAYSALGRPYSYGAAGPGAFDCSGLTLWSWAHAGVALPHSSAAQYGYGAHVSQSALQPGDLVFFYRPISHVGVYVGGGKMIDAPHTGTVVALRSVLWSGYVGAVRPG